MRRIEAVGAMWANQSPVWEYMPDCTQKVRANIIKELVQEQKLCELKIDGLDRHLFCSEGDLKWLNPDIDKNYNRVEFLAPLDNVVWDRNLLNIIFNCS